MTSLGELREALDKIDNEIAELYEKRMEVCRKVGEYKVKSGKKVFDRQREKEKLADVMSKVEGDFNKKGIQELYQQLMSMSRKLQYSQLVEAGALGRLPFIRIENLDRENARVVFQGTEGAYSQAQEIIDNATSDANAIRIGAIQYTDDLMANAESIIGHTLDSYTTKYDGLISSLQECYETVRANRAELDIPTEEESGIYNSQDDLF